MLTHTLLRRSPQDLFAHVYRKQLSKRLLNQRSASDDAERSLLLKLKLRCGAMFTGKMEGMMADLRVGTAHQKYVAHSGARDGILAVVEGVGSHRR